ncbi:hypothetical protein BU17DRAFT_60982 [Hysterangium stoloniferum]|nr:hypothetical protein BU17DRAFT_60982 [Hysterangium stoloniferum]
MSLGGTLDSVATLYTTTFIARDASKYLSGMLNLLLMNEVVNEAYGALAAGGVVLIYDHVLLFPIEVDIIWHAKWNWWKALFIFNRYSIPLYIIISLYVLQGVAELYWRVTGFNPDNHKRVYALWDYNKYILRAMVVGCILTYAAVLAIAITTIVVDVVPHTTISPWDNPKFNICMTVARMNRSVEAFALPVWMRFFFFLPSGMPWIGHGEHRLR